MWIIKIIQVDFERRIPGLVDAFSLNRPQVGDVFIDYRIPITGWTLGKKQPVRSVHVHFNTDSVVIPVELTRQGVVNKFLGKYPWVGRAGFQQILTVHPAAGPLEFSVSAKVGTELVEIGKIKAVVEFERPSLQPKFTPIIVTSLGRTGTTLCMQALSQHPDIVTTRTYPFETRMAQHFMECLQTTLEFGSVPKLSAEIISQFSREVTQSTIQHYVSCIDQFYSATAQLNEQSHAHYFVEKSLPNRFQGWFYDIYPDTKEFILVRDFRDMLCSIFSFNNKRGIEGFSRQNFSSDLDYIQKGTSRGVHQLLAAWQEKKDNVMLVRYEDLILEDMTTLTKMFEYLGLDASPAVVKQICEFCAKPTGQFKTHITSGSRENSIGRWRRELSAELLSATHEAFGDVLVEFGYEI